MSVTNCDAMVALEVCGHSKSENPIQRMKRTEEIVAAYKCKKLELVVDKVRDRHGLIQVDDVLLVAELEDSCRVLTP